MENNPPQNELLGASIEILDLNNNAIQLILEESLEKALDILKDCQNRLIKNKNKINDPKVKIIINHNLACCYQKMKNVSQCISHLEKVNADFDQFIEEKHKTKMVDNYFLEKILSEESQPNILLGDFILELRFSAKFHLQMCAAYSQDDKHKEALSHAKLAALICEDNIVKTFFLLKQIKKDLNNEKIYSKIFAEKVIENEPIITSLYKYIIQMAKNYNISKEKEEKEILTHEKIESFINNKKMKISTRNILGVIKSDDWLNLFTIGNIMFLCAMSYDDLDLDSDPKYELLRDAIIEKILMLTVAFFSISNELRFLNLNTNSENGSYYQSKALEIACLYLPSTCPIIKHYLTSYSKYYGNGNEIAYLEHLNDKNTKKEFFDISKDPILNIGEKEIKIVDSSSSKKISDYLRDSNTINNSMNNTIVNKNESGSRTERKRDVKSAATTGRGIKGSSLTHYGKGKEKEKEVSPFQKEIQSSKGGESIKGEKSIKNNYIQQQSLNAKKKSSNTNGIYGYNFNRELFLFKKMMK